METGAVAPAAAPVEPPPAPGGDEGGDTRRLEAPPDWDKVRVTHLLPSDHQIHEFMRRLRIGRDNGDLCVPGDPFLSSKHAEVRREQGQFVLYDLGSRNGTYVQIRDPIELQAGDELMMGRQILRFQQADESAEAVGGGTAMGATRPLGAPQQFGPRLVRVIEGGKVGETFLLGQGRSLIGRDEGDICLADDPLLSGIHASVTFEQATSGHYAHVVRDENSRNGVFIKIRDGWPLKKGDKFTVGRQVFRFDAEGGE
ncbi:MAG TPA: FHA domain-containing protein [Longimicrobiales bacterium]|jgi:pSer/pThr/pTyr-binding forkhead associated (FHA) protein